LVALFQCPDKPNVTNNIVCSLCGGAGHIAKDCRQKRPGDKVTPPSRQDKAKIDQEVNTIHSYVVNKPCLQLKLFYCVDAYFSYHTRMLIE
jgi:hypothetical protein